MTTRERLGEAFMRYGNKTMLGGMALVMVGIFLSACGTHASAPDPAGKAGTNAVVIQEPYGFRNVAFSCFGHNGVYVTSRSIVSDLASGVYVQANDEHCR